MKKTTLVLLSVFLLIGKVGLCNEAAARQLYDSQKFQDALTEIQKSGFQTVADYYNAGNSLFKLGKFGQAYAYYFKASQMDFGNSDIEYNLSLAKEGLEKSGTDLNASVIRDTLVPLSARISWPFYLFFISFLNLFVGYFLLKKDRAALYGILVIWFFSVTSGFGLLYLKQVKLAASLGEPTLVRSGPKETFTEIAKLNPGTKIELMGEKRDGWTQVRFSLGNLGWVMEKDLLEI